MLKLYFLSSIRSLYKNKLISLINIIGLTLAISVAVTIAVFLSFKSNIESIHANADKIYMITSVMDRNEEKSEYGIVPSSLPRKMFYENESVEKYSRVSLESSNIIKEEYEFSQTSTFVDPDFFRMFTFKRLKGDLELDNVDDAIISKSLAQKLFGQIDIIGKELIININSLDRSFKVKGVFEDFEEVTAIDFDLYLHINVTDYYGIDKNNPRSFVNAGFVQIKNNSSPSSILSNQELLINENNSLNYNWIVDHFNLIQLNDLSAKTSKIQSDIGKGFGSFSTDIILILISLSILIIACLNNANLLVVNSSKRLNEIALRKIYGANKLALVIQFLIENFFIIILSFTIGILLAKIFLIPGFDELFNFGLKLQMISSFVWLILTFSILITVFLSISYPAFYISSFSIIQIFKGKLKFGGKNWTSKLLHIIQFTFSIILIFSAISIFKYVNSEQNKKYGYQIDNLLFIELSDNQSFSRLKNILENRYSNEVSITGTKHHVGTSSIETLITGENDKQIKASKFDVGENYFDILDLNIIEGENFEQGYQANLNSIVVNEAFVKQMGWKSILNKSVIINKGRYYVVGVVNDFIFGNPNEPIRPAFFRIISDIDYNFLVVNSISKDPKLIVNELNEVWVKDTGNKLEGKVQSSVYFSYFKILKGHSNIILFLAILATVLSVLGLYALLSLSLARKMKTFSIKKVLGVSNLTLVMDVSRDVLRIVILAIIIGSAFSIYSMSWLFKIVYKTEWTFEIFTFIQMVLIVSLITIVTLSKFILTVINTNPIKYLRHE
ncbi:ABC transporter permease [Marivirga sp.]|uniref:ABC transporter permease n=1 Tax=Marivirga sp. TaxID=2018662 RepID=UPI003DA734E9